MFKLKQYLFAVIGLFITVLVVDATQAGQVFAQNVKSQLVQIMNTPDQPVPVAGSVAVDPAKNDVTIDNTGANPVPVAGNVNLGSNSSVGIDPNKNMVKLDAAAPVAVRDVMDGRQPWQGFVRIELDNNLGNKQANIAVSLPAGKRLVIEQIGAVGTVRRAENDVTTAQLDVTVTSGGRWGRYPLTLNKQTGYWNADTFVGMEQARLYADNNTNIQVYFVRNPISGDVLMDVSVSGYLVDAQ